MDNRVAPATFIEVGVQTSRRPSLNAVIASEDENQANVKVPKNFRICWSSLKYIVEKSALKQAALKAQGHKNIERRKVIFENLNGVIESGMNIKNMYISFA